VTGGSREPTSLTLTGAASSAMFPNLHRVRGSSAPDFFASIVILVLMLRLATRRTRYLSSLRLCRQKRQGPTRNRESDESHPRPPALSSLGTARWMCSVLASVYARTLPPFPSSSPLLPLVGCKKTIGHRTDRFTTGGRASACLKKSGSLFVALDTAQLVQGIDGK
jgi:hypothetical protein